MIQHHPTVVPEKILARDVINASNPDENIKWHVIYLVSPINVNKMDFI